MNKLYELLEQIHAIRTQKIKIAHLQKKIKSEYETNTMMHGKTEGIN